MNKPFAIVPCCTYSQEFPKRKLPDGRPVRKYEELIEYLQLKHPSIKSHQLEFEGRNTVLFWIPDQR